MTENAPGAGSVHAEREALQDVAHFVRAQWRGPACARSQSIGSAMGAGGGMSRLQSSARPPTRRMPGESSSQQFDGARQAAHRVGGSCDFSKRMEASVRSFSAEEVLRMVDA